VAVPQPTVLTWLPSLPRAVIEILARHAPPAVPVHENGIAVRPCCIPVLELVGGIGVVQADRSLSIAEVSVTAVAPPVVAGSAVAFAIAAPPPVSAAAHPIAPPRRMRLRADLMGEIIGRMVA
jgi:hypothetical protein